jgi:HSP20 family protein
MNPESLQIQAVRNQLTISGEKEPSAGKEVRPEAYHRSERAAGSFVRSFTLPAEVEQEKAEAEYKNGLLRIRLPKAETAKPRQITVKVA